MEGESMSYPIAGMHPLWCDPSCCRVEFGGWHRSVPAELPLEIPQTGSLSLSLTDLQRSGAGPLVLLEVFSPEPDGTPDPEPVAVLRVDLADVRRFASSLILHADTASRATPRA